MLLGMQSLFWFIAAISSAPFVLAGEYAMGGLVAVTLLLSLGTCLLGIGVLWRRRRARAIAIALEVVCLLGAALLLLVPIGANHGPVSLMVNIALPIAVIVLLRKDPREPFSR